MDGDDRHRRRAAWEPIAGREDGNSKKVEKWQVAGGSHHALPCNRPSLLLGSC